MDQFYFEAGYLEAGYLTIVKQATAGFTPYIAEGYLPADYFDYGGSLFTLIASLDKSGEPAFAVGAFAVVFTTSITANVIASGASNIAATFTQASTISHIEGADLFAFSNAQLEAAVRRIRDNNITASAVFSVAVDITRTRNTSSDDSAQFSFTANTVRSRDYASSQSAAFSLAAAIDDRTRNQSSALASQFAFTATISHIEGADLVAFSNAELTATATRTKQFASSINVVCSVSADVKRNPGIILNLSSQFTQTAQVRIASKGGSANLSSSFVIYTSLKLGSRRPFNLYADDRFVNLNTIFKVAGTSSLVIRPLNNNYAISSTNVNDFPTPLGRSEFGIQANENFVFETWIYITGNTAPAFSRECLIAGVSFGAAHNELGIRIPDMRNYVPQNSCWMFGVNNNGYLKAYYTQQSNGLAATITSSAGLTSDGWTHIAFRRINGDTLQLQRNGTIVASATYSGSLLPSGPGQDIATNKRFFLANTFNSTTSESIYFDETSYRVGSGDVGGYSTQPMVGDPASQQLLFHYESNQSSNTDYIVIADDTGFVTQFSSELDLVSGLRCNGGLRLLGAASVSSSGTVTANVDRVRFIEFAASISSAASTATTGLRVKISAASLASEFSQSADVARTRGITSNQPAVFTQTAQAVKTANIVSALDSQATFTGTISHIEGADLVAFSNVTLSAIGQVTTSAVSTQSSAFTSNADILRIRFSQSTQTSQFNLTALATANFIASSSVSSEFTHTVNYIRNRSGASSLSSESTFASDALNVQLASAALNSNFDTTNAYYDPDYIEVGYFKDSIVVQVNRNLEAFLEGFVSQFNASVKTARVLVDCAVVSTLTANVRVTSQANAALTSDTELLAYTYLSRTARISATITSAATLTGDITGLRTYSAALDVMAVVDCEALKTGDSVINISSQTTLTAQPLRIKTLESTLSSLFSTNIDAVKVSRAQANLESASTVSTVAVRSVNPAVQLSSAFTFIAQVGEIQQINLVAFSNSTLTADVLAGKFAESNQNAAFTQTAAALRFRDVVSAISSNFTQTATVGEIVQLSSTIDSQATVSANINKTASASSSQTAVAIVSCIISHIEGADLVVNGFASLAADVDKIVGISVSATSAVNLAASADKFRAFNANLVVSTTVIANAVKALLGQATLQAQATIVANATRIKQFTATIASALTFVAQIREIDAASLTQFVYIIPREDYVYTIPDEIPVYNEILYVIPNENWTYTITAETRVFPVDEETRIYNIRSS